MMVHKHALLKIKKMLSALTIPFNYIVICIHIFYFGRWIYIIIHLFGGYSQYDVRFENVLFFLSSQR